MKYSVYEILRHQDKKLLLIQDGVVDVFKITIYNEHTGSTEMRPVESTLENLELAIQILKSSI
jgi:hypothetical protein